LGICHQKGLLKETLINIATGQYNPRNLNTDQYRNYGFEFRSLTAYKLVGSTHHLSSGLRLYNGHTRRFVADGKGSVDTEYNMQVSDGIWTRDVSFSSMNIAAFAENVFRIGPKLLLIPGLRYELVEGAASGRNGFSGNVPVLLQNQRRSRGFLLTGIGAEYHIGKNFELYGNASQAYRPVQFAELSAPPTTDVIDQQLKDAKGYNADLGFRGRYSDVFIFDGSLYYLQYNNRIGTLVQQRADGSFYNFRTNVGESSSRGIEALN